MTAYYNEFDTYAADWLRNLIAAGHIADGVVDTRSIEDVTPRDLVGFTQCHFFAGIGVWSYALRLAGVPDDRPVWTGSCPCQPFSAAGHGAGFDDERHLWPAWYHLIRERKPAVVLGEQVASKDADAWVDLVHDDLEALGYAFGAVPFPSASVGAPHIRDRLYWVADAQGTGRRKDLRGMARGSSTRLRDAEGQDERWTGEHQRQLSGVGSVGLMADDSSGRWREERPDARGFATRGGAQRLTAGSFDGGGAVGGFWLGADWIYCRDDKWRPVEPGVEPLVDGAAGRLGRSRADQERLTALLPRKDQGSRVGRLRGYGNAINAQQAAVFIGSVM